MTRKLMSMVLAAGAMLGAWGDTYESPDGRVWTYYVYDGMATMSGVESASGALNIPAYVTDGNAIYSVGSIASCAFQNLTEVSSVTIPASVTSIEWGAFYGCTGLRSVSIPVSVKSIGASAFQNCASLEQVALPISLSRIEQTTFYGCSNLWRVDLPVTITSIEDNAFYGCVSLSSLNVPLSVKRIADRAFYGCSALSDLELNEGLESIGYEAFYGCTALRTVMIPSSVTSISSYAFAACENVRSVTIPSCMVNNYSYNINNVFDNCETITSVTLQEGCEAIGYSTFNSCSGLTSLTIPASVAQIDDGAFRSCTSLENITVASGNPNYKFSNGLLLTKDGTSIAAVPPGRTWVSIPDTVTSVSPSVFNDCTNLNFNWSGNGIKSIDGWIVGYNEEKLPPKLTLNGYRGIANWAFEYCSKLTNVTMGEGMTAIGASAFAECANLTSVSIPASVTTIGEDTFYQTFRLKTITLASGNRNYKYSSGLLASADNTPQLVAVSRDVTSVKIPEGVTAIPDRFFAGCTKLTSVTIPASLEEIGDDGSIFAGWEEVETDDDWYYKFHGCPALKTITVATGNLYWKSINGLLLGLDEDDEDYDYYLKAVPQAMTSVSIPEDVGWISSSAFAGCSKLTSVTFPKSLAWYDGELYGYDEFDDIDETSGPYKLTAIKVAAGNEEYSSANGLLLSKDGTEIYCVPRGLTSVTIPASVTEVVPDDFEYCAKIKSFSVENGNKEFSAVNGMLLTKDGKELVCVPPALKSQRTITIPADVTRIGGYAFSGFGQLTSVVIPEGIVEIGDGAFSGCESLAKVTLPTTLRRIGARAFFGCVLMSIQIPDGVERIGLQAFATYWWPSNMCHDDSSAYVAVADTNSIAGFILVDGWLVDVQRSLEYDYSAWTEQTYTDYINEALQDARIRGIADGAFQNCSGLCYVTLPTCVKYIGADFFWNCSGLEWVSIPESVKDLSAYAFRKSSQCVSEEPLFYTVDGWALGFSHWRTDFLEREDFDGTVEISGVRGIAGGFSAWDTACYNYYYPGLANLVIGDGVESVGSQAFAHSEDLTNVYVAASVRYIGEKAFYDCRGLQSVYLPDTLEGKIPDSAFANCPESLKITYYEAPRPVHTVSFRDNYTFADDSEPSDLPQGTTNGRITKHTDSDGFEDWYWTKKITVERGNAHTFYITGLTENTAITGLDVYCDYTYKDDGEVYEDSIYASECFEVANSAGGYDKYVILRADDWLDVPTSKSSLAFTVIVYGWGEEGYSSADMSFKFGHSDGKLRPVVPTTEDPLQDSRIVETREVEEGRTIGVLPEISRDQYRFLGWFTAPEGGEKVTSETLMGEEDVAYWAHWKDMSQIDCYGPLIIGDNVEITVELVDYAVSGLPSGLKYDAKSGKVTGSAKVAGEYEATFTKKGEDDVTVVIVVREEKVSVGCAGLSGGAFVAGVAGNADGIPLEIESETDVKSVAVTKLPAGMKYDTKTGLIIGAPTKPGDYAVTVTVTTKSGAKRTETIAISVAALPDNVVGVFNGFVKTLDGEKSLGTFQLMTTDVGKLTAKVVTAAGTYSFSGTCWDKVEDGVYSATLATKKGDTLTLALDSAAGWSANQLTGTFTAVAGRPPYPVVARKNAFGKMWYFNAAGNERDGWRLSYAENAKAAALTVTLNADGSTKIAGKLVDAQERVPPVNVSASGYADVTSLSAGVIIADFAPVVSVKEGKSTLKRVLSIGTNLWFDRSNAHPYIGSVYLQ